MKIGNIYAVHMHIDEWGHDSQMNMKQNLTPVERSCTDFVMISFYLTILGNFHIIHIKVIPTKYIQQTIGNKLIKNNKTAHSK